MSERTTRKAPTRREAPSRGRPKAKKAQASAYDPATFHAQAFCEGARPRRRPRSVSPEKFERELLDAMRNAGTPPQIVYALAETGLLRADSPCSGPSPSRKLLNQWDAAIDRYFALMAIDEMLSPERIADRVSRDPRAWNSELPELQTRPLTGEEYKQVLECLKLIAPVQGRGMTVIARSELASALLAHACSSAYGSAEAQGVPAQGPERYALNEDFILRRARELYAQGRA